MSPDAIYIKVSNHGLNAAVLRYIQSKRYFTVYTEAIEYCWLDRQYTVLIEHVLLQLLCEVIRENCWKEKVTRSIGPCPEAMWSNSFGKSKCFFFGISTIQVAFGQNRFSRSRESTCPHVPGFIEPGLSRWLVGVLCSGNGGGEGRKGKGKGGGGVALARLCS